ncbi:purine nucleoside phosphorylase-like isoform X1 [Ylistrum balloti]|uniref:purine nucleoside phosphorylase-like isoform X1 n=1 Tax=Ylistrum balloti TaxID=509963 RepID=UPI002905A94A|nr:purine nucleoside phosphorylase-like isoform X1 [Ylistrum balloti]
METNNGANSDNAAASYEEAKKLADDIMAKIKCRPVVGIICGSGLGELANMVKDTEIMGYEEIPGFPVSTVPGHAGKLVFGQLGGKSVVLMKGRVHFYEGFTMQKTALPIRIMKLMGVKILFVTNAAGGINQNYDIGDLMIIKDHINMPGFAGMNPLHGQNDERFGPRFPAISKAYTKRLRDHAKETAKTLGFKDFNIHEGVYCMLAGPSFETVTECKFLSMIGVDVTGMSTCPEVIVAAHCGMEVFGMSLVTNKAVMQYDSEQIANHEEVLETGALRSKDLQKLVAAMLETLQI